MTERKIIYLDDAINALESKKDKKAKGDIGGFYNFIIQKDINALMQLPSAQPDVPDICCVDTPSADVDLENYSDKLWKAAYELGRREAVVDVADNVVDRVFRDLNISCAYSMPSFWCHDRTDYAVIPTRYYKGYQKALEDAEKKIREALGEIAQGDKE